MNLEAANDEDGVDEVCADVEAADDEDGISCLGLWTVRAALEYVEERGRADTMHSAKHLFSST